MCTCPHTFHNSLTVFVLPRKHLAELNYPAPRAVSKLEDQASTLCLRQCPTDQRETGFLVLTGCSWVLGQIPANIWMYLDVHRIDMVLRV